MGPMTSENFPSQRVEEKYCNFKKTLTISAKSRKKKATSQTDVDIDRPNKKEKHRSLGETCSERHPQAPKNQPSTGNGENQLNTQRFLLDHLRYGLMCVYNREESFFFFQLRLDRLEPWSYNKEGIKAGEEEKRRVGRRGRKGRERVRARNLSNEWWLVEAHYADVVRSIIKALEYDASRIIGGRVWRFGGVLFFASFHRRIRSQLACAGRDSAARLCASREVGRILSCATTRPHITWKIAREEVGGGRTAVYW